jgi:large subunit ribosomal protein LP0
MGREDKAVWKANFFTRLVQYLEEYPKCFIVGADNVGSKQMQQIRGSLRGTAAVLMGKNTMMRKAIKGHLENNPALEKILPHVRGNVGFVFTAGELSEVREVLLANKVRAPARPKCNCSLRCYYSCAKYWTWTRKNIILPSFGYCN